jgi:hypothetical protein
MGGSIGRMNAPNSAPPLDLRAAIEQIQNLAINIAYTVSLAEYASPGSDQRDDHAIDALKSLEELEGIIRDARAGIEAMP